MTGPKYNSGPLLACRSNIMIVRMIFAFLVFVSSFFSVTASASTTPFIGACLPPASTAAQSDAVTWIDGGLSIYSIGNNTNAAGYQESGFQDVVAQMGGTLTTLNGSNDYSFTGNTGAGSAINSVGTFSNGTMSFTTSYTTTNRSEFRTTTAANFYSGDTGNGVYIFPEQGGTTGDFYTVSIDFTNPVNAFSFDLIDIFDTINTNNPELNYEVYVDGRLVAYLNGILLGDDQVGPLTLYDGSGNVMGTMNAGQNIENTFAFIANTPVSNVSIKHLFVGGVINANARDPHGLDTLSYSTDTECDTATLSLVNTVQNNNSGSAVDTDWTLTASDGATTYSGIEGDTAITSSLVKAGTYTISSTNAPLGYDQTSLVCHDSSGTTLLTIVGSGSGSVTLSDGDDVTCGFFNTDTETPAYCSSTRFNAFSNSQIVGTDDGNVAVGEVYVYDDIATDVNGDSADLVMEIIELSPTAVGTTTLTNSGSLQLNSTISTDDPYVVGKLRVVAADSVTATDLVGIPAVLRNATFTLKDLDSVSQGSGDQSDVGGYSTVTGDQPDHVTYFNTVDQTFLNGGGPVNFNTFTQTYFDGPSWVGITGGGHNDNTVDLNYSSLSEVVFLHGVTGFSGTTTNRGSSFGICGELILPATLTLVNDVVNDDSGSASDTDWTLSVSDGTTTYSGVEGDPAITDVELDAGNYTISSSGPSGYSESNLSCTGAADTDLSDGLTLAQGEDVTCTFTNDDEPAVVETSATPTAIVSTNVTPEAGYCNALDVRRGVHLFTVPAGITELNFKGWGAGGHSDFNNQTSGPGGYTEANIPVTPGDQYTIIVGGRGGFMGGANGHGFGGEGSTAGSGGGLTGLFTGSAAVTSAEQGRAVIISGGGGGSDRTIFVDPVYTTDNQTGGSGGDPVNGGGQPNMRGADGDDIVGSEDGTFPRASGGGGGGYNGGYLHRRSGNSEGYAGNGGTNYINPALIVAGTDVNLFTPEFDYIPPNTSDVHYVSPLGEGEPGAGAGNDGLVVIQYNDGTCDDPLLTLEKTVVNDNGGTSTSTDWTLQATDGTTTVSGVQGDAAITAATVAVGTYTLTESGPAGYAQTDLSCTGAADTDLSDGLTLAQGEDVTCTFTNNDLVPDTIALPTQCLAWNHLGWVTYGSPNIHDDDVDFNSNSPTTDPYVYLPIKRDTSGRILTYFGAADETTSGILPANRPGSELTVTENTDANHESEYHISAVRLEGTAGAAETITYDTRSGFDHSAYWIEDTSGNVISASDFQYTRTGGTGVGDSYQISFTYPAEGIVYLYLSVFDTSVAYGKPTISDYLCPPTLTLEKSVVNDADGTSVDTDWTLSATDGTTTISGIEGNAAVTSAILEAGTYTLSESGPAGYTQTDLSCIGAADTDLSDGLTVAEGEDVICTFVNDDIGYDYGDAPDSYGTLDASGGAAHKTLSGLYLGSNPPDDETDGQPSVTADGDGTDEDGVSAFPVMTAGETYYTIPYTNLTASGTGTIYAWLDFDGNGSFEDTEFTSVTVTSDTVDGDLTWTSQSTVNAGTTYVRLRYTSDVLTSSDANNVVASDGEVEDYQITIDNALPFVSLENPTELCTANWYKWQTPFVQSSPYSLLVPIDNFNPEYFAFNKQATSLGTDMWYGPVSSPLSSQLGVDPETVPSEVTSQTSSVDYGIFYNAYTPGSTVSFTMTDARYWDGHAVAVFDDSGNQIARFPDVTSVNNGTFYYLSASPSGAHPYLAADPEGLVKPTSSWSETLTFTAPANGVVYIHTLSTDEKDRRGLFSFDAGGICAQDRSDAAGYGEAIHNYLPAISLGSLNDPDASNIENVAANGDGNEDDSVTLATLSSLDRTYQLTVNATNETSDAGRLIAWIDFDGNGTFDTDEAAARVVPAGTTAGNFIITWSNIPADVQAGASYLRLRFTTDALNAGEPSGYKFDGEVEDYTLTIQAADPTVSGRIYIDANSTATDDAGEGGIAGTVVVLQDSSGVCRSAVTNASGEYAFTNVANGSYTLYQAHGETTPTPQVCGVANANNPTGYQSTTADTLTINVVGSDIADQDFGEVAGATNSTTGVSTGYSITFEPDHQSEILPGSVAFYAHTFTTQAEGTVRFTTSSGGNTAAGWAHQIFNDSNCNGVLDGSEASATIEGLNFGVATGARMCIIDKVFAPANAPARDQYLVDTVATFSYAGGSLPDTTLSVTDLTITGQSSAATSTTPAEEPSRLELRKTVENISEVIANGLNEGDLETASINEASPGDVLRYRIYYRNTGTGPITDLSVNDSVPSYSTLVIGSSACDDTPTSLTCSPSQTGDQIEWGFVGTLNGGTSGNVSYEVMIDN